MVAMVFFNFQLDVVTASKGIVPLKILAPRKKIFSEFWLDIKYAYSFQKYNIKKILNIMFKFFVKNDIKSDING